MKDAFGGILSLVLIALFLVIVEGVLGMTVNYTKAFRMKNYVISAAEQYEDSGCFGANDSPCLQRIKEHAGGIGYSPAVLHCPSGYSKDPNDLFCYKEIETTDGKWHYSKTPVIYRIITQVDVHIPIINHIMGLEFFQVKGETRVIEKPN